MEGSLIHGNEPLVSIKFFSRCVTGASHEELRSMELVHGILHQINYISDLLAMCGSVMYIHPSKIYKRSPYLIENAFRLHYKDQPVNSV